RVRTGVVCSNPCRSVPWQASTDQLTQSILAGHSAVGVPTITRPRGSSILVGGPDLSIRKAHRPRESSAPGLGRGRDRVLDGEGEVGGRGRSPEDVALGHGAAEAFELGELGDPFDTLGDHGQGYVAREAEQVAQEHRVSRVGVDPFYERAVDLYRVQLDGVEAAERGVPDAEVVE